uniref:CCHC-type domain-containing protein n=1 Tax=Globodera pallida TaxID=36090 RepID=A0A183CH58_GLOPA
MAARPIKSAHFSRECPSNGGVADSEAVQLPDCINCNSNGHNFFQCKMPPLNNNSNDSGHFSHTAGSKQQSAVEPPPTTTTTTTLAAASSSSSPSKKVLARRHRHYNKKNRLSITVSSHARVPEKIKVNCRSKRYEVEGIIATYVHTNKETAYFVKWLGKNFYLLTNVYLILIFI